MGESTHIAAYVGVSRYSGVDTDATWVGQAREDAKEMNHFKFSFGDIGSTRIFGVKVISVVSHISPTLKQLLK